MPPKKAPLPPPREVAVSNRHPGLRLSVAAVRRMILCLDAHADEIGAGAPPGELSVAFLPDADLAALHGRFLDDPTPTDVITFEGEPALGSAGEVCVSPDTAAAYARRHGRDFSAELTLYMVHGWLHLAGFDDLEPAKKRKMRRAEARAMAVLDRANAQPRFSLRAR